MGPAPWRTPPTQRGEYARIAIPVGLTMTRYLQLVAWCRGSPWLVHPCPSRSVGWPVQRQEARQTGRVFESQHPWPRSVHMPRLVRPSAVMCPPLPRGARPCPAVPAPAPRCPPLRGGLLLLYRTFVLKSRAFRLRILTSSLISVKARRPDAGGERRGKGRPDASRPGAMAWNSGGVTHRR